MKRFRLSKKVAVPLLIILAFSFICFSQEWSNRAINGLSDNPKLNFPEAILKGFKEGEATTQVIVNLVESRGNKARNLNNENARRQLRQEVCEAQNRVIDVLDSNHVFITNRFTYIFGFSAEVTEQGLRYLLDNPDVFSIDDDTIIHAHTKPLLGYFRGFGICWTTRMFFP